MKRYTVEILSFLLLLPVEGMIVWHSIKTGENNVFIPVLIGLIIFMVIFFSLKNFSDYRTEKGERSVLIPIVYSTFIIISTIVSLAVIVQLYISANTLWTLFCMTMLVMLWYSFYLDKINSDKGNKSIYINYIALPVATGFKALAEYPVLLLEAKKQKLNIPSEVQIKNTINADTKQTATKEKIDGLKQDLSEKNTTTHLGIKDYSEWVTFIDSRSLYRMTKDDIQDLIYDFENLGWNGKYTKSDIDDFIGQNYESKNDWYIYKGVVNK